MVVGSEGSGVPAWIGLPLLIVCGGFVLARVAKRVEPGPWLRRVILVAYGLRVVLAVGLYAISSWRLPVLTSLQTEPGFWVFSPDAFFYDYMGRNIIGGLMNRNPLADPGMPVDFFLIIGGIYRLLGVCPLYPILLNCLLGAAVGLLAYWIGQRLFSQSVAKWSALVIAFWPSAILWSSQLLKDALCWFLALLALSLIMKWIPYADAHHDPRRPKEAKPRLLILGGLTLILLVLTWLRWYIGVAIGLAMAFVLVMEMWQVVVRRKVGVPFRFISLLIVIGVSIGVGRMVDLRKWYQHYTAPLATAPAAQPREISADLFTLSPQSLGALREGFTVTGGHSLIDAHIQFTRLQDIVAYLPQALMIGLFAPFPTQWFDAGGNMGAMRMLASLEMGIVYLLFPGFVIGVWHVLWQGKTDGLFFVAFIAILLVAMSLVVNNVGVLFRLRLHFLLPLLIIAVGGYGTMRLKARAPTIQPAHPVAG